MGSQTLPQREFKKGEIVYNLCAATWQTCVKDYERYSYQQYGPPLLTVAEGALLGIFPPADAAEKSKIVTLEEKVQHLENRLNALTKSLDILKSK